MKKLILFCIAILLLATGTTNAQESYNERVKRYVEQYRTLALQEQMTSGIPACITLGQGILETEAGASELMTEANNHFGIKCNKGWDGPTFAHTDDAPNECFKKYTCAAESFKDHSLHLKKNPRYSPLFSLSTTDYASWAVCLKKCGYATNPQYAQKLIKIIEEFKLQQYTYLAMDSASALSLSAPVGTVSPAVTRPLQPEATVAVEERKEVITQPLTAPLATGEQINMDIDTADLVVRNNDDTTRSGSGKEEVVNGLRAFFALKDEMLLSYAVKYNVRYPKLLEMNDLADAPLPFDMYVYLEKKLTSGLRDTHTVLSGENMLMIAQSEGIQLKRLAALNMLPATPTDEPPAGTVLQLQKPNTSKADAKVKETPAHKENAIVTTEDTTSVRKDNYIVIDRTKPAVAATEPVDNVKPESPQVRPRAIRKDTLAATPTTDLGVAGYGDDRALKGADRPEAELKARQPESTRAAAGTKYHTVQKGETAYSISKKYGITIDQLYKWNNMDATGVKIGKALVVQE